MSIVVLGASGFLGSWAVRALVARGEEPVLVVRPSSDLWRLAGVDGVRIIRADESSWDDAVLRAEPSTVLALDWAGVAGSAKNDTDQWANLDRLRRAVEAAARAGAERFIGVGSQAEYGPHEGVIAETADEMPVTEYGKAKLAGRRHVEELAEAAGIGWCWARVFSTYGPLDHDHWLLPGIARAILSRAPVPLTEGVQRWSYLYAPDAGEAFAAIATAPDARGVINIGSPRAPALRSLVETFAAAMGVPADLRFGEIPYGPGQVMHLEPDLERLEGLGWTSRTSDAAGLDATARWLRGEPVGDPLLLGHGLPARPAPLATQA